jgi:hypothetical protein
MATAGWYCSAARTRSDRAKHHHDPDQVRKWLTALSIELRDAQTQDWRWWQLVDTIPRSARGMSIGLSTGLLFGSASVLATAGVPDPTGRVLGMLVDVWRGYTKPDKPSGSSGRSEPISRIFRSRLHRATLQLNRVG